MQAASSKRKADSTKKRSRNDLELESEGDADDSSKETKRRNTSTTPVRTTVRPPRGVKHPSPSVAAASDTRLAVTSPKVDSSRLEGIEENSEMLVPPSASAVELTLEPTETATVPTVSSEKPEAGVTETANGNKSQLVEAKEDGITIVTSFFKGANWIWILALWLAVATGMLVYGKMCSRLIIGELRQDIQNCRALQSQDKLQDEYYIKELETQVRGWKQEAKAKGVELEALRIECQGSR